MNSPATRDFSPMASTFWDSVALRRSYVIGGHSDHEHFFPTNDFAKHLTTDTCETCNTYNMLKLTRELFALEPDAAKMDFYERGLYNHILASQDPETGMFVYFMSLKPGHFKTYSTPEDSFWCCVGTGMENHAKYGDTIYFHDADSLFVNLFIASELTWPEKECFRAAGNKISRKRHDRAEIQSRQTGFVRAENPPSGVGGRHENFRERQEAKDQLRARQLSYVVARMARWRHGENPVADEIAHGVAARYDATKSPCFTGRLCWPANWARTACRIRCAANQTDFSWPARAGGADVGDQADDLLKHVKPVPASR